MKPDNDSFWGRGADLSADKAAKRRDQETYARHIREAAEQDAILSPRVSLAAANQRRSRDYDSATGLILGIDVSTAVHNERKKQQQQKYRQELAASAIAPPIEASRASLRSHHDNGDTEGCYDGRAYRTSPIGRTAERAQEGSAAKMQRTCHVRRRSECGRERPHDSTMPRMASPISYSSQPSYDAEKIYPYQYSSRELPPSDTELELGYLRMMKERAAQEVRPGPRAPVPATPRRLRVSGHSSSRLRSAPSRTGNGCRCEKPDATHRKVRDPPQGAAANSLKYEKPPTSQCTGLVIGGMTVLTAAERTGRQRQQQQYAEDIAKAARAKAIEQSRVSWAERHRYQGNCLPGEHAGRRGASGAEGRSSLVLGDEGPAQPYQAGAKVSLGRMLRRGKQEEYAAQLRLQVQESQQVQCV